MAREMRDRRAGHLRELFLHLFGRAVAIQIYCCRRRLTNIVRTALAEVAVDAVFFRDGPSPPSRLRDGLFPTDNVFSRRDELRVRLLELGAVSLMSVAVEGCLDRPILALDGLRLALGRRHLATFFTKTRDLHDHKATVLEILLGPAF